MVLEVYRDHELTCSETTAEANVNEVWPRPEDPIERADLSRYFEQAERSDRSTHMVGTEFEKFGVAVGRPDEPLRPVTYADHIVPVFDKLVATYGWEPGPNRGINGEMIELRRAGASITLEPGGQLEISGAPVRNVHQTYAEISEHRRELDTVSEQLGLAWFAAGHHPWATREEISWMPKARYAIMRRYLPTRGAMAIDMMLRTCTVQANLDYASEQNCGERLRLMSALGPFINAMFANSSFREGKATGRASWRAQVWTQVDPDRCGIRPLFFEDGFSYERYVDWALDVPMFFVKRGATYHPFHETFRTFLARGFVVDNVRLDATWADWGTHLSTLFPEVRIKPYLEFRSADAGGSKFLFALPALLKGLVYDEAASNEAWEVLRNRSFEDRLALTDLASRHGLRAEPIRKVAVRLFELARQGLERHDVRDARGRNETRFLLSLEPLLARGVSPGDLVIEALGEAPGRSVAAQHAFVKAFHFAGALG